MVVGEEMYLQGEWPLLADVHMNFIGFTGYLKARSHSKKLYV